MSFNLQGKKIIVTGAGRGIGRDIVENLHGKGAIIHGISKTQGNLDNLHQRFPNNLHTYCVDLENWEETRKVVESIGLVDGVVNNAGYLKEATLLDATPEDFEKIWKTNVASVLNVSQVAVKAMIAGGKPGSIVNISSNIVNVGGPTHGMYAASKAALDRLTKSMALEWGQHGIRANCINPSITKTDMLGDFMEDTEAYEEFIKRTPLGRLLDTDDISGAVLFMLSDMSKMISGEHLVIDGGYRCY